MNDYKLKLILKGERDYVHGTTLFDEIIRLLSCAGYSEFKDLEFVIHQMTSNNLRLLIETHHESAPSVDDVAVMRFVANGQQIQARIRQDEGTVNERMPYDETAITNSCQINADDRNVRLLHNDSEFSPIEVLVSMNKALHLAVLDKPENTSWVFCRWDSPASLLNVDLNGVVVSLKQTLGSRLTRADVELGGQMLGHIYFSAKAAK